MTMVFPFFFLFLKIDGAGKCPHFIEKRAVHKSNVSVTTILYFNNLEESGGNP